MTKKIAVVGISGSGKSFLARKIGEKTGLPVIHMDQLFWKGNWEAIPEKDYLIAHQEILKQDTWIIEGYIDEKMAERIKQADLVIYLDYPGILCFWRVLFRYFKHKTESRPELPKESLEKFNRRLLWVALTQGERKDIEVALKYTAKSKVVRLNSPGSLCSISPILSNVICSNL